MGKASHGVEKRNGGAIDSRKTSKMYSRMMELESANKSNRGRNSDGLPTS